jgi:hypothetical protein
VPFPSEDNSLQAAPDPRLDNAVGAIKQILEMLAPADRERALAAITEAIRPIPAPRAGEVLGEIVRLLPSRREWTVENIKREIAARGIGASAKEIYNSLGYLVRKGRIRRVGYGRYLIEGVGLLETADELGVEPARDEEDG